MPVKELPPFRVRDLMHIGKDSHDLMCEAAARLVTAVTKLSSGLILNTFDALERRELEGLRRDLAVPVFDIGPLHKFSPAGDSSLLRQDRSCLEWLDAWPPESVLYVSFGSLACMSAQDLVETAWGIAGSGVPFLWVVRPGLVRGCAGEASQHQQLPEGFEAATRGRGRVVAWAPQEEVLRHRAVGGFWTHNGWNSATESICEGVPMLCRPYFGDQTGNTRYVEHVWRVGFEVGGDLERGTVEAAIRRLMIDKDGAEMRARAGELKKAAAVCTGGKGGSSCMAIDKLVTHIMSLQAERYWSTALCRKSHDAPAAPTMAAQSNTGHGGRRCHVLLFPLPYQGHINPMFQLAGLLHARGFAITVFHTHYNAPDPVRHPHYRFVPVPDGMSGPAPVAILDVVAHIIAMGRACEAAFRDRLAAVLEEYSRDAVACLVADTHLLPVFEVARTLSVPTLALRTGSAASCACFLAYPMLFEKGYLPVQGIGAPRSFDRCIVESQRDMPVPELPPYRVRDLVDVGEDHLGLERELIARAVAAMKLSSGVILNTFDALERRELERLRRDLAMPVFDIGPLHKFSPAGESSSLLRQDRTCLDWLDAWPLESVLYVSFGSLACVSARDLAETAWGIAASGVPFLWAVRPGLVHGSSADDPDHRHLPNGFEAATRGRGMVVAWAPQEEVLRHRAVGGFWTHGGWNSTAESVCEGVPMLCCPCFGDQMGNARYVGHVWRVGFEVGGELERGSVEAAIRRLMADTDGAEMRARAGELKKAAAECTRKGGSSCLAIDKLVAHMITM
ncbi:hypothetical protein U9M48_011033 [Paspalum notatum var. saurae]|uniref:UDP-glycosyltransferase n=1 Tax=Paspalum notatum var. saurae TaxID=547442 RepID=A0AAQ3SUW5_PASNO